MNLVANATKEYLKYLISYVAVVYAPTIKNMKKFRKRNFYSKITKRIPSKMPHHTEETIHVPITEQRLVQSYAHAIVNNSEYILVHSINNKTWAAIDNQNCLVPISNFKILENTSKFLGKKMWCPVFGYNSMDGFVPILLHDMMRQIYAYGWTSGIAMPTNTEDVWEWNILTQCWKLNGTSIPMVILTPRGQTLSSPPVPVLKKHKGVKRCEHGHWLPCQAKAKKCRHCK